MVVDSRWLARSQGQGIRIEDDVVMTADGLVTHHFGCRVYMFWVLLFTFWMPCVHVLVAFFLLGSH
jgi:uncharacterized membrane protein YccF (DUF307 family)